MDIKINSLDLDKNRRKIFISDIHANLSLFKSLLEKINFNDNDYLFILGDFVGKGSEGIKIIRYIMDLVKKGNTYVLMGNHEMITYSVYYDLNPEKLKEFLIKSKKNHVIIKDMLDNEGIIIDNDTNMLEVNKILKEKYSEELKFLVELDHVIVTNEFYLAHAALFPSLDKFGNNVADIIKTNNFRKQNIKFDKLAILGHWPAVNYSKDLLCCNPFYDNELNIYFIDGGLMVKTYGQLNALMLDNGKFYFDSINPYSIKEVLNDQNGSNDPKNVIWIEDPKISILDNTQEYYKCIYEEKEMMIHNKHIYYENDEAYATDTTNYFLNLKKGDKVYIISKFESVSFVKKNGILGWAYNTNLK